MATTRAAGAEAEASEVKSHSPASTRADICHRYLAPAVLAS